LTTLNNIQPYDFRTKLSYGVGSVAFGVKDAGFGSILLLFYNQALGLDARMAALAIAIALVVDAFIDPFIGYTSDHFRSRLGRRHPFMYAAAVPAALSYAFLFSPPLGLSQTGLFGYLLVFAIIVRICIALFEIPNSALIAEFTQNYDERTSYLNWRLFFGWVAGLSMSVAAFGVFLSQAKDGILGTQVPSNYQSYGIASAVIMLIGMLMSAFGTHHTIPRLRGPVNIEDNLDKKGFFKILSLALLSRSALMNLLVGFMLMLSTGLVAGISPYLYSYLFALTPNQISILYSAGFISAFVALGFTPLLVKWFDKRQAYIGATIASILIAPIAGLLQLNGLLPASNSGLLIPFLFTIIVFASAFLIIQTTLYYSMSADIIEENEVKTGHREEGIFFAANIFVRKCATGLGVLLTSMILAFAEFPEKATQLSITNDLVNRLFQYFIISFLFLNLATIVCVYAYKITRARHIENLLFLADKHQKQ